MLVHIEDVVGPQFLPTDPGYVPIQEQYASSTYEKERDLKPGLIVMAKNIKDIQETIRFAKRNSVAVAVRTGGHQYSGASSTSEQNIQLDLSTTFRDPDDLQLLLSTDGTETVVRTSVSWSLGEFIDFLSKNSLFVPTGQCTDVHLGGHVQTGGYGQLARSFGLLADHVMSLDLVDHDGNIIEVNKSNADMFYGLLGGSPGNLGVITHVNIKVHRDSDYNGSMGLLSLHLYTPEKLKHLLDILVKMSDDDNFPGNYDLCVSVVSRSWKIGDYSREAAHDLKRTHPDLIHSVTGHALISGIAVYAQWVKFGPNDAPDMDWFNELNKGHLWSKGVQQKPMSEIVKLWLFTSPREFNHPYVKRTLLTSSPTLAKGGWPKWITEHIDKICTQDNGLFVSAQIQASGGKNSKLATNEGNGTSYSWRDSRLGCTMDCFHKDDKEKQALEWEAGTDKMISANGPFAQQERRLLWGSFGNWIMEDVWNKYYDSEEKYRRLQRIRKAADPNGTFTPNPFCVPAAT